MHRESSLRTYPGLRVYVHMFALLPGALGAYSGYLQLQAYLMGEVGKTKPSTSKMFVVKMLQYARETTGREHYDQIACLLIASAAAAGS